MKKLNITKEQYNESKYFNKKYGSLKFVSESGKLYKTDKGVVLALESSINEDDDDEPKNPLADMGKDDAEKEGEEEVVVKKEDLASALQGVIDTVKDIAADNDVVLPEEEDKEEDEEKKDDEDDEEDKEDDEDLEKFDEKEEGVCPTCGAPKNECGGVKAECGPGEKCESTRRARRARLVREALARRARARKIRESIERRARAKKVLESIRRRRMAKKVMEARKLRAKKVLESIRRRRLAKKVMESRKIRARRARLAR